MDIEQYYDKIYRYIYFKVNNRALAEDLTQETFLRFINTESKEPERYLYTIAKNLCIDHYRKNKASELDIDEVEVGESGFEAELIERVDLRNALQSLDEEERELLILRFVNEEPLDEICKLMKISRFAIYRRIKAAKELLKARLERRSDER